MLVYWSVEEVVQKPKPKLTQAGTKKHPSDMNHSLIDDRIL